MQRTTKTTTTIATLAALTAASIAYNNHITATLRRRHTHRRNTPGNTAWQVVAGTAYTLAAAIALIALWTGRRNALHTAMAMAAAFTAAGAPMLLGDIHRDL